MQMAAPLVDASTWQEAARRFFMGLAGANLILAR